MQARGIPYNIEFVFDNGVRIGNIPSHKSKLKRTGTGQSWFPDTWSDSMIEAAGEAIANSSQYRVAPNGSFIFGEYNGARIGVFKNANGDVDTIFPDSSKQPHPDGSGDQVNPIK